MERTGLGDARSRGTPDELEIAVLLTMTRSVEEGGKVAPEVEIKELDTVETTGVKLLESIDDGKTSMLELEMELEVLSVDELTTAELNEDVGNDNTAILELVLNPNVLDPASVLLLPLGLVGPVLDNIEGELVELRIKLLRTLLVELAVGFMEVEIEDFEAVTEDLREADPMLEDLSVEELRTFEEEIGDEVDEIARDVPFVDDELDVVEEVFLDDVDEGLGLMLGEDGFMDEVVFVMGTSAAEEIEVMETFLVEDDLGVAGNVSDLDRFERFLNGPTCEEKRFMFKDDILRTSCKDYRLQ